VAPPAPPGVIIFGTEDDPACQALKSALDRANVLFKLAPRMDPLDFRSAANLHHFEESNIICWQYRAGLRLSGRSA